MRFKLGNELFAIHVAKAREVLEVSTHHQGAHRPGLHALYAEEHYDITANDDGFSWDFPGSFFLPGRRWRLGNRSKRLTTRR